VRYKNDVDVFASDIAEILPPHRPIDHVINLESPFNLPYGQIYILLEAKLQTVKAYVETMLANEFIHQLSWPASPILFATKKDGALRLCFEYEALN